MTVLLVLLGGAVGAPARYVTDVMIQSRNRAPMPWGTLVVNLVGSFILGVVGGAATSTGFAALVGTGFCGALTTYSTFGFETVRLLEERKPQVAATYVGLSLLVGLAAVSLGWWVGSL